MLQINNSALYPYILFGLPLLRLSKSKRELSTLMYYVRNLTAVSWSSRLAYFSRQRRPDNFS